MGTPIALLLWIGLAAAATGGGAGDAAPVEGKSDLGPTTAEIDAAISSVRRELATDRAGLIVPVAGISARQLVDTFGAARAGGRRHGALDIMAPRGSPVVAAASGTVEKLYFSRGGGGITAYVRSDDGRWMYYYAHLQAYAPGLREGARVARGEIIARVGSTGNANPAGPHLHFAVYRMAPGERYYQGQAVNPYPLLAGMARRR